MQCVKLYKNENRYKIHDKKMS